MRFRFFHLNPFHKTYISRISSCSYIRNHNPVIQVLNPPHFYDYSENPNFKISKRWHVGHSHSHHTSGEDSEKIFRLGLLSDIGLATGKAVTGYLSGSTAIIADAAHSISDVVNLLFLLFNSTLSRFRFS